MKTRAWGIEIASDPSMMHLYCLAMHGCCILTSFTAKKSLKEYNPLKLNAEAGDQGCALYLYPVEIVIKLCA